jgi:D-3-phosphoglycerate dehydrogenase
MTFKTGQQENTVAGCVQPGGLPRLLEIDGIHVEAPLEGNVIYLRNLDVPGVIGRVGTVLGQHNVNIANFSLGRGRNGQEASAIAVVQVDGEIKEPVLESLRGIETILLAKAIRFVAPQPKTVSA